MKSFIKKINELDKRHDSKKFMVCHVIWWREGMCAHSVTLGSEMDRDKKGSFQINTRGSSLRLPEGGYYKRLHPFYSYPEQMLFIDETSKDGRDSIRSTA